MSPLFARGRACRIPRSLPLVLLATRAATRCSSTSSSSTAPSIAALLKQTSASSSPPRLASSHDEPLTLNGFVRSVRKQKRVAFAAIGDGSSLKTVQAVLTPEQADGSVPEQLYHTMLPMLTRSSVYRRELP